MEQTRWPRSDVAALLVGLIGAGFGLHVDAAVINTTEAFVGVTHYEVIEASDGSTAGGEFTLPRPLVINILEIDPTADGIDFRMQPGNGAAPGEVTRMTTRSFVDDIGAQIGINGDFYNSAGQSGGQFFANVVHTGVSDGTGYSSSGFDGESIFNLSAENAASVLRTTGTGSFTTIERVPLFNAIGGNQRLVTNGINTTPIDSYTTALNPHTALGVTFGGNVLLMTVDGRQSGYSEGMRTDEMAELLIDHFNARDVINVDGGGSTTLVMDDIHDGLQNARVVNRPSDGNERLVANNLAVFAMPRSQDQAKSITVGPGAFEYRYNSQTDDGFGIADPNAVLSDNVIFSGDGNAPNLPPNFVNFYRFGTNPQGQSPDNGSVETVTYTFEASTGQEFDGNLSVTDRLNVFNFLGNIRGEFSTDGGATFTDYTLRGTEGPEYATNLIDVDGADSVILRYNLFSIAPPQQEDQVQLFRQANVGLGNLEQTPFVVSGVTVDASTTTLAGDYNGDSIVDAADYTVWRDTLGQTGMNLAADGNGNDAIDSGDYQVWKMNFGESNSGQASLASATVPEPTSAFMLIAIGVIVVAVRVSGPKPRFA